MCYSFISPKRPTIPPTAEEAAGSTGRLVVEPVIPENMAMLRRPPRSWDNGGEKMHCAVAEMDETRGGRRDW
jgi:hypothetical protein